MEIGEADAGGGAEGPPFAEHLRDLGVPGDDMAIVLRAHRDRPRLAHRAIVRIGVVHEGGRERIDGKAGNAGHRRRLPSSFASLDGFGAKFPEALPHIVAGASGGAPTPGQAVQDGGPSFGAMSRAQHSASDVRHSGSSRP